MNADLAALIPPVVICVAVLVAVGAFLRHEMSSRRGGDEDAAAEPNRGADRRYCNRSHCHRQCWRNAQGRACGNH